MSSVLLPLKSCGARYVIFPAVIKYAFRSATVPAKVRAVPVPPTVIPVPGLPMIVPTSTLRVTVRLEPSTSEKSVPEKRRLPVTSSVSPEMPSVDEPEMKTLTLSIPCHTFSTEWLNVSFKYFPIAGSPFGIVKVKESVVQVVSVRRVTTSLVPRLDSVALLPSATACAETVNVPGAALPKGSP